MASGEIVRSRVTAPPDLPIKEKLAKKNFYNVLNKYRSYSYITTMSCLDRVSASQPEVYRTKGDLGNIILKSSGKVPGDKTTKFLPLTTVDGETQKEIDFFNEESAGRFNLYINNIEIETFPTPQRITGTALITKLRFDVFEPYSIVGFIEALTVASRAAGYKTYLDATFLLKIEFIGYKDDIDGEQVAPEPIDLTTRFIPFKFSKVDVDFDESGTKYRCEAFPSSDLAFTDVYGSIKTPISLSGLTVKEILTNLVTGMNTALKDEAAKTVKEPKSTEIDEYVIEFPTLKEDGTYDVATDNDIAKKPLKNLYSDSGLINFAEVDKTQIRNAYQLQDAATTATSAVSVTTYEPSKFSINFGPGTYVQGIIDGIIRDSEYWREQIDPGNGNAVKTVGEEVNFWKIVAEIEQGEHNPVRGRPRYKITYKVIQSKIHVSQVTGYRTVEQKDSGNINVVREYNYIYTGQNVDIKKLNISFDKLFYERFPWKLANPDQAAKAVNQNPDGGNLAQYDPATAAAQADRQLAPKAPGTSSGAAGGEAASTGNVNAFARDSFNQIILSNYSMIKLEADIVGDPVFLMTGGLGNYLPSLLRESDDNTSVNAVLTTDGEANFLGKNIFIKIYFRSGMDIDDQSLENGGTGLLKFNQRYNLSGYYLLTQAISSFKDGEFSQKLKLNRIPVDLNENDFKGSAVDTKKAFKTVPNPDAQVLENSGANENVPANERSSLKELLSGVNKFADSLENLESNITDAIEGAVNSVAEAVAAPVQIVGRSVNKITGALQGIDDVVTDAADRLGLSAAQLGSLSAGEIAAMLTISKLLPDNVSIGDIENRGIIVSRDKIKTTPPANTKDKLDETKVETSEEREARLAEIYKNNLIG